jgi:hypothetical protein
MSAYDRGVKITAITHLDLSIIRDGFQSLGASTPDSEITDDTPKCDPS